MLNRLNVTFLVLWALAASLAVAYKAPRALLLPLAVFVAHEIVYSSTGLSLLFSPESLTENFYDVSAVPTRLGLVDTNYSEGYYAPGVDLNAITPEQAEAAKFNEILRLLGAMPGDTILDLGSGTCTFEEHCRSKGIRAVGMTLSGEQVAMCKRRGLEAIHGDFTLFHPKIVGKFDHVVILGSPEHVATGPHHLRPTFAAKKHKMATVLKHCRSYVRQIRDGRNNRVFFSGLHINPRFTRSPAAFVLDRAYGGTLQLDAPGHDVAASAATAGLSTVMSRDATRNYYLATALNPQHFGNPSAPFSPCMLALLALGVLNPFLWYMYVYATTGCWTWMFDGKMHTAANKNLSFQEDPKLRPTTLKWHVFEWRS